MTVENLWGKIRNTINKRWEKINMYKNIIFDIGNVLLRFNPKEHLMTKLNDEALVMQILKEVFQCEEWSMLDRGTITEEGAKKVIGDRKVINKEHVDLAFENWYDILTPMEETIEILKKLKNKGYNIYFLSNFHHLAFEHVTNKNDFFKEFHGGIVSYKERLLKPEKEIYLRLLEEYDLKAEESIFIDDTAVNLAGAKELNINTILFKDANGLVEELKKFEISL